MNLNTWSMKSISISVIVCLLFSFNVFSENNNGPLIFTNFNVNTLIHSQVEFSWVSIIESKTKKYILESSDDAIHFDSIASQDAIYRNDNNNSYSKSIKLSHFSGIQYYRIKIILDDKKIQYSQIISLENKKTIHDVISIYPNPSIVGHDIFVDIHESTNDLIDIKIFRTTGKNVAELKVNQLYYTLHNINKIIEHLKVGAYIFYITINNVTYNKQVIVH